MVLAFVVVNILWLFVWHYFVNKCIEVHVLDVLKDVLPFFSITIAILGVTYFITKSIENIYMLFISKVIVAVFLYCMSMYLSNSVIFKESISFLLKKNN